MRSEIFLVQKSEKYEDEDDNLPAWPFFCGL
jgi:hypothetical protein